MSFQPGAVLYCQSFGSRPESVEVPHIDSRDPTVYDTGSGFFPIGKRWVNKEGNSTFTLTSFYTTDGIVYADWQQENNSGSGIGFLEGDTGGPVGPDGFDVVNIVGGSGVEVVGSPGAHSLTVSVFGTIESTATTVGATSADVLTFDLGTDATVYSIDSFLTGFDSATPAGVAYTITAGARTTGSAATLLGRMIDDFEESPLTAAVVDYVTSGNNLILRVTGVAGKTIEWKARLQYLKG